MIDRLLKQHLLRLANQYPVVTLTGPRQSGKTTLTKMTFPQMDYANLENSDTRRYAVEDPRSFLGQFKKGAILDEIQRAPDLPSYIQGIVDEKNKPGLFILTGSQQFEVFNTIRQSLAGRTAVARLLPFALQELYANDLPSINEILYKGFYPRIHDQNLNPTEALSFYVSTYVERDLRSLVNVRDLASFEKFLRLCASQVGQLVNFSKMGADCGIDSKTAGSWLSLLQASYIIFLVQPHFQNFRKRLVKSPKIYFYDVGLVAYLLGISNEHQLEAHPLKGNLFENFVVSEILKHRFNHVRESNLYFFRDHLGNEVDLILDYATELISVEIKMGTTVNPDFFRGLNYYAKLGKKKNRTRFLIYGGETLLSHHDIEVVPYKNMDPLFKQFPP